jgi:hypothetical protein
LYRIRARPLDALQRLAGDHDHLLADLRTAVDAGDRHLDPDGTFDERLDRIVFQLLTTGSVFPPPAAPQQGSGGSSRSPRWWHTDIE